MFLIMPFMPHHIDEFRCECCTVPSVSSLHVSFAVFLDELQNKPEVVPAPLALLFLNSKSVEHTSPWSHFYHDKSLFLRLPVIGCWHFDKRQRSRSAGLLGGVWIRAGCFYICHRAPGLRPRSDPDLSSAPPGKLPINPAWLGWEWAQASPPNLPPHSRSTVQASEPYQSRCNFSFHLGGLPATVIPSLVLDTCNVIYMPLFLQIIRRFLWR